MQAFVLRCLIILIKLDSSIAVEWSRILRQFLHEILEYSFNVKIIWINLFQMLNCLFTSIFLTQSELSIFFWILLMTLSSTDVYNHHCWNWALISALYSSYWLFSLNIKREVSRWILFIASWILTCKFIRIKTTESRWMNDWEIKLFLDWRSWQFVCLIKIRHYTIYFIDNATR